jgi:hypothetical protein
MVLTINMPGTVSPGGTMTVTVSGAIPGSQVGGGFDSTKNSFIPIPNEENGIVVTANSQGVASWRWHIKPDAPTGFYEAFVLDLATGTLYPRQVRITSGFLGLSQNMLLLAGAAFVGLILLSRR